MLPQKWDISVKINVLCRFYQILDKINWEVILFFMGMFVVGIVIVFLPYGDARVPF